jgi:hypothetical protein
MLPKKNLKITMSHENDEVCDLCDESLILDAVKYNCNACGALCSTCAAAHAKMKVIRLQFSNINILTVARD